MTENIYDSVRPLHLLLKISGFAFYSVNVKTLKIKITLFDAFLLVLYLFIVITLNFLFWTTPFKFDFHGSEIVKNYFSKTSYLNFIAFTLLKLWMFFHRYKFEQLLQLIQDIDHDFEVLGICLDYTKHRKTIIWIISPSVLHEFIIIFAFYFSKEYYDIPLSTNVVIFVFYGFFSNVVLTIQYLLSICGVKQRYKAIKDVLW